MRNRLIFVLAIFMSLGLVGCGQGSSSDTTAATAEPAKTATADVQPIATDNAAPTTDATTTNNDNLVKDVSSTANTSAVPPPAQASPTDLANTGVTLPPSPTTGAITNSTAGTPPVLPPPVAASATAPTSTSAVPAAPIVMATPAASDANGTDNKTAIPAASSVPAVQPAAPIVPAQITPDMTNNGATAAAPVPAVDNGDLTPKKDDTMNGTSDDNSSSNDNVDID